MATFSLTFIQDIGNVSSSTYTFSFPSIFYVNIFYFIFLLPLLTMRTFSEERKNGTETLLLSSPLNVTQIVMAKFLATATILLMMLMGSNVRSILIALCLSSWVGTARITRSQVVSLKHQEYALAAKLAGASDFQILLRHLLPNAMGPIIVSVMFLIPGAIFSEAFLSFLGIGIQKPMASWGSLANDAIGTLTSAPYQMFFPIAAISLTMFSLNFIGDGLRDALDPKLKK